MEYWNDGRMGECNDQKTERHKDGPAKMEEWETWSGYKQLRNNKIEFRVTGVEVG